MEADRGNSSLWRCVGSETETKAALQQQLEELKTGLQDDKAKEALADKLEKYPFKATVNEGSYGCQIEVKPLGSIKVFVINAVVINAEGRKKRGTLADLKRGPAPTMTPLHLC